MDSSSGNETGEPNTWVEVNACFDELRRNAPPWKNKFRIMMYLEAIAGWLLGQKRIVRTNDEHGIVIHRKRLRYEVHVTIFWDQQRNGFDISVVPTGFVVRVTSNRTDPPPFDLLLKTICKIDESVIKARGKDSAPLEYHQQTSILKAVKSAESHVVSRQTDALPDI